MDVIWNPQAGEAADSVTLADEMARYQRAMLGSGHGFWEWDLLNNKMYWFGSFWRELGYSEAEALTMTEPRVMLRYVHHLDRHNLDSALKQTIKYGAALDLCYRVRSKLGYYIWVRVSGRDFRNSAGKVVQLAGVNYNISQLKQTEQALRASEARYSRIVAGTRDAIWDWDIETGKIEFADVCWEQIGFSLEEVRSKNLYDIADWGARMSTHDVERFSLLLRQHILERVPFDIEYQIKAKDGSMRWLRARAEATYNKDGRATRVSGSNMDVTELKTTQLAVVQAKIAAEKANQAKSEFLSSMSHELRTPLNAILGYTQLFDYDSNLQLEQTENLTEIRQAGTHLLHLINEVLDLARIEAGKLTLSLEPVIPERVLDDCFRLLQPLAEERKVRLLRQGESLGQITLFADNTRLKQALINLISNAIKYNRVAGEVVVSLEQPNSSHLRILIRDTGYGIPEDKHSQVFEPFNRLNADRGVIEGSGVGLVITKRLVEMMKGQIGFQSKDGAGSQFWIDLPIAKDGEMAVSIRADEAFSAKRRELQLSRRCKVLYIEDNPANTRLFEKIIARFEQLEVKTIMEPVLGLYEARTNPPDIIVLDINLPDLDGYEVLEILKSDALTSAIPVVALSANAMALDVKKGLGAGFADYLTKPVDVNRLIDVFNRHLT
ncbi:hybrid sensor histidine kinase/response regulator [Teredinibacter waterburyi]|uniref:hybrid sensor histidine kinase/response regulator n=1 Tax=Teredinibacter waterburyi TaxID=1500538 RepID=UPI001FEAB4C2|nr:ATP-binding protein [Teredinibacter waterburyi]